MTKLRETRVLDYYDEPLVIEARDEDGHRYICDVLEPCEDGLRFLVIPVTDAQVDRLNNGATCLRCTMEHVAPENGWYLSVPQWDFRQPFAIERQEGPLSEYPDLPGEGYTLTGAWDD